MDRIFTFQKLYSNLDCQMVDGETEICSKSPLVYAWWISIKCKIIMINFRKYSKSSKFQTIIDRKRSATKMDYCGVKMRDKHYRRKVIKFPGKVLNCLWRKRNKKTDWGDMFPPFSFFFLLGNFIRFVI